MTLEERVLQRVVPSVDEETRLRATVEDVRRRVAEGVRRYGIDAEPLIVGSVAKGTHLSGPEIDVFVRFPRETPRDTLESVGLDLGSFLKERTRMYAEHPYTRGWWNGFEVEIVPCYRITDASQKMSAVDRSPLHATYVLEHLRAEQRNEVRLLKAFCEGVGVYGAEAKIQGFSGYLCELLVLKYGTFHGVLEAAKGWRRGTVMALGNSPAKEFPEPLVFVDPVDAGRNVASAVGEESLATFVHAAKAFLAEPRMEFFFPGKAKAMNAAHASRLLRRRGTTLLGLSLPAPPISEDVLYPQLFKAQRAVEDLCRRAGFRILRSRASVVGDQALLLYEFEVFELPAAEKHHGPPAWVANADDFLARWRKARDAFTSPYIEGGRWAVDVRREATDAGALIREKLPGLSLGPHLEKGVRRARILTGAKLVTKAFLPETTKLLDPRFPWEKPVTRPR